MARRRPQFHVRRIYDEPDPGDGYRVLVDRLWPRGISKDRADIDEWAKDVAPSTELRRWYGHDPAKFPEFARRYRRELNALSAAEVVSRLRDKARKKPVALVTATRDVEHSGALVLMEALCEGGSG
jgi:uncharacterized protein YeaO (DUF488 family)